MFGLGCSTPLNVIVWLKFVPDYTMIQTWISLENFLWRSYNYVDFVLVIFFLIGKIIMIAPHLTFTPLFLNKSPNGYKQSLVHYLLMPAFPSRNLVLPFLNWVKYLWCIYSVSFFFHLCIYLLHPCNTYFKSQNISQICFENQFKAVSIIIVYNVLTQSCDYWDDLFNTAFLLCEQFF